MRPMMAVLHGGRNTASSVPINLSDRAVEDSQTYPTPCSVWFELESDGDTETSFGFVDDWLVGSTTGSDWECRATILSGSLSSGTTGSWLALSSDRRWTVSRSSLGTSSCSFTLEIGRVGTSTALKSATIQLSATVDV